MFGADEGKALMSKTGDACGVKCNNFPFGSERIPVREYFLKKKAIVRCALVFMG
jgi:hypothetical protein